jgi:hypothetical protein
MRGQALFVELQDEAGNLMDRWQSCWIEQTVTWEGQAWRYQQMEWAGITSGQATGAQASITMPRLPSVDALTGRAVAGPWLAFLLVYQFPDDEGASTASPPADMILVGSTVGQVVKFSGGLTEVTWQLGSALSPVGAQFPPRTATDGLIGVPCLL